MANETWEQAKHFVTNAMLEHTRSFVTPLSTETPKAVRLVGTGTYIDNGDQRHLITCEHVARQLPMHYRFSGSDDVFKHSGPWTMDRHPIDAAFAPISPAQWSATDHQAEAVPKSRFANRHQIVEQAELLFFRGFAGENSHYGFEIHQTNGSGYCSQQKLDTGDSFNFELFWEPKKTEFASAASAEAQREIRFEDAQGFSGSLVWNTRYVEVSYKEGRTWTPADAVITGLLRRWDQDTNTLLVWRVEHLNTWLASKLN